ncbi:MAG: PqqD family protein [Solobacterium sp.]|nr:PqqD family protein [Solobacterium sp.]
MNRMRIRDGVVLLEIQGTYLLVADKEARKVCRYVREVSETAGFLWKCMEQGMTVEEMTSRLMMEYDIEDSSVPEEDIQLFIEQLQESGYLTVEERDDF